METRQSIYTRVKREKIALNHWWYQLRHSNYWKKKHLNSWEIFETMESLTKALMQLNNNRDRFAATYGSQTSRVI